MTADHRIVRSSGQWAIRQCNAPADFVETANTIGLPRYAKQAVDQQFARWVMLHVQSNPLADLHPAARADQGQANLMTVFPDAVDATFGAFGIDAVYTPAGGAPLGVRVIARRPDTIVGFGDPHPRRNRYLRDARERGRQPAPDDQLTVGGQTFGCACLPRSARRDQLAANLRAWTDPDEDKPMTNRKTARELIAEAERDAARMKAQDEADRIEQEAERRVQERLEQERAARKPPIYRSTLSPKRKSELMRKMGPERYLGLPWSASRP